jgi:hypothetical protein
MPGWTTLVQLGMGAVHGMKSGGMMPNIDLAEMLITQVIVLLLSTN